MGNNCDKLTIQINKLDFDELKEICKSLYGVEIGPKRGKTILTHFKNTQNIHLFLKESQVYIRNCKYEYSEFDPEIPETCTQENFDYFLLWNKELKYFPKTLKEDHISFFGIN